jgi:NAD+ diphosphatase
MLGFIADYASGELILNPAEIADAGWFERESLPPIPPMASISGQLIQAAFSE